jgi:hypothetical protein
MQAHAGPEAVSARYTGSAIPPAGLTAIARSAAAAWRKYAFDPRPLA